MNFELLFLLFSCFFPSLKSPSNPVYGAYRKLPAIPDKQKSRKHTLPGQNKL